MAAITPGRVALLSFVNSNQTWTGTTGTITVTGTSGTFTPGDVTWTGTGGTITVTGTSGSWVPGTVTWVGADGTISIVGASGAFIQVITAGYVCLDVVFETVTLTVSEDC